MKGYGGCCEFFTFVMPIRFHLPHPSPTRQTSAVLTMVAAPFSGWLKAVLTVVARPRWLLLIIFVLMDCYASVLLLTFGPKYIEVRVGMGGVCCRKICVCCNLRSFTSVLVINLPYVDMRSRADVFPSCCFGTLYHQLNFSENICGSPG